MSIPAWTMALATVPITAAVVLLLGRLVYWLVARDLAHQLREYANRLDPHSKEPPGIRHAADFIAPRTRRRNR